MSDPGAGRRGRRAGGPDDISALIPRAAIFVCMYMAVSLWVVCRKVDHEGAARALRRSWWRLGGDLNAARR